MTFGSTWGGPRGPLLEAGPARAAVIGLGAGQKNVSGGTGTSKKAPRSDASAAVAAATEEKYAKGFELVDNLRLLREFDE